MMTKHQTIKSLLIGGFIFLMFNLSSFAETDTNLLEEQLNNIWKETQQEYQKLDPQYIELSEYHKPRFKKAINQKKEIVYLLHGYLGTPYEMMLFENKAHALGYDVYNDVIYGHGFSAELANLTTRHDWMRVFNKKIDLISQNYSKIHFVGFSTGGLMISKLLKDREDIRLKTKSTTLISPFFEPDFPGSRFFLSFVPWFFKTLSAKVPDSVLSHPDVQVVLKHKDFYLQDLPVLFGREVVYLADQFREEVKKLELETKQKFEINLENVFIHLTVNDRVLEYDFCFKYLSEIFPKAHVLTYQGEKAPHHLMMESVSKETKKIEDLFLFQGL